MSLIFSFVSILFYRFECAHDLLLSQSKQFFCELSLLEAEPYLQYTPSKISAAAIALARFNFSYPLWSRQLEQITGYDLHDLTEIILYLGESHNSSTDSSQQAIQEKYKTNKYVYQSLLWRQCPRAAYPQFLMSIHFADIWKCRIGHQPQWMNYRGPSIPMTIQPTIHSNATKTFAKWFRQSCSTSPSTARPDPL